MNANLIITDVKYQDHKSFWEGQIDGRNEQFCFAPFAAQVESNSSELLLSLTADDIHALHQMSKGNEIARMLLMYDLLAMTLRTFLYNPNEICVHTPMLKGKTTAVNKRLFISHSVNPYESYKEHLQRFKAMFLNAFKYADFPIEIFAQQKGKSEEIQSNVLFAEFDLQETATNSHSYDLCIFWKFEETGVNITFASNGTFSQDRLKVVSEHFKQLLQNFGKFDQPIGSWLATSITNETKSFEVGPALDINFANVIEAFKEQVQQRQDALALEDSDVSYSYQELDKKSDTIAAHILDNCLNESTIGVLMDRKAEAIVAMLGIFKAGKVYVPQDPRLPKERIRFVFDDAAVQTVLTEESYVSVVESEALKAIDVHQLEEKELFEASDKNKDAYIIYTSGTTGKPKGVQLGHAGLVNMVQSQISILGVQPTDKVQQFASLTFDASISEIFMALNSGASLSVVEPDFIISPKKFEDECIQRNITVATFPPSYLNKLNHQRLETLRVVLTAGESPIESDARELTKRLEYFNAYGPTEFTVCSSMYKVQEDSEYPFPIGHPIHNATNVIVNDWGYRLPKEVIGHLVLAGKGLAKGYKNMPELTELSFRELPALPEQKSYKAGDFGMWNAAGELMYLGRKDQQIKINGYRVELMEIKNLLLQQKNVSDAYIDYQKDDRREIIVAYAKSDAAKEEELFAQLRAFLADYLMPHKIVVLTDFPLTHNGKVDIGGLRDILKKQASVITKPINETQERLCEIWQRILGIEEVGTDQNFFELGGDSIGIAHLSEAIKEQFEVTVNLTELFGLPTILDIENYLNSEENIGVEEQIQKKATADADIAVIGMSCRFPGASNYRQFWKNLEEGREGLYTFSAEELEEVGITTDDLEQGYITTGMVLKDKDLFDAPFFSIRPEEAEIINPQTRMMMMMTYEALEDAGIKLTEKTNKIGLYVGGASDFHWEAYHALQMDALDIDPFTASQITNKDFMATYIAYKLNLTGPAVMVQSACSTALLSIHNAVRELQTGTSNIALAGGVALKPNSTRGYFPEENSILSMDGHCRPFDSNASGTIAGEGGGLVVLKKLEDAQKDGDRILAVIKGSSINNDGNRKVGYAAPSIQGQSACIAAALNDAGKKASDISYVETHGTGTKLGDPVEISALQKVFGNREGDKCKIGSVKSNIGHLDSAAGIAGFMKLVLSLEHRILPASLNVSQPTDAIDWNAGSFEVQASKEKWEGTFPLAAGISSFGIGGTNVHMILEEGRKAESLKNEDATLLLFSGKTEKSVQNQIEKFKTFSQESELHTINAEQTLQLKREHYPYRSFGVLESGDDLIDQAVSIGNSKQPGNDKPAVVFMYPGQGTAHTEMSKWLRATSPIFNEAFLEVATRVQSRLNVSIEEIIDEQPNTLKETLYTQLSIFAVSYGVNAVIQEVGIAPDYLIGHSLGELMVGIMANTLSLDEAIDLIIQRDVPMRNASDGRALTVLWSGTEEALSQKLPEGISLAAVNSDSYYLVSGPGETLEAFKSTLKSEGVVTKWADINFPPHSQYLSQYANEYKKLLEEWPERALAIPVLSTVKGALIKENETIDGNYWYQNLTAPVCFKNAVQSLLEIENDNILCLEIGPEDTLSKLVKQTTLKGKSVTTVACLSQRDKGIESTSFKTALGKLWQAGVLEDFSALYGGVKLTTVGLPTYGFDTKAYNSEVHFEALIQNIVGNQQVDALSLYTKEWQSTTPKFEEKASKLLVFASDALRELNDALVNEAEVITVVPGNTFEKNEHEIRINGESEGDYRQLMESIKSQEISLDKVIFEWSIDDTPMYLSLQVLLNLVKALNEYTKNDAPLTVEILTHNASKVFNGSVIDPNNGLISGAVEVLKKEYSQLSFKLMDIDSSSVSVAQLKRAMLYEREEDALALRMGTFWRPVYVANEYTSTSIEKKDGMHILITGGASGIGKSLGEMLTKKYNAKIVVIGRRNQEELAFEINDWKYIQADITDRRQLNEQLTAHQKAYGTFNGVIHAAGIIDTGGMVALRSWESIQEVLQPKVEGTLNLWNSLDKSQLSFFVNCSSLATMTGPFGELAYAAANTFQNEFALAHPETVKSIAWCSWLETGVAHRLTEDMSENERKNVLQNYVTNEEGFGILEQVLAEENAVVYVSRMAPEKLLLADQEELELTEKASVEVTPIQEVGLENFVELIESFFGLEHLNTSDDFFDLGGDSLRAIALINKIAKVYQKQLDVKDIYDHSKIEDLYNYLKNDDAAKNTVKLEKVEVAESYPLSKVQEKLWIISQIEQSTAHYNVFGSKILHELDVALFEKTLNIIVQRLDILRTTIHKIEGEGRQKIANAVAFKWQLNTHDLTQSVAVESEVEQLFGEIMKQPFDLSNGPLFRFDLVRMSESEYLFLYVFDHIIFDGISSVILSELINETYLDLLQGKEVTTSETYQYVDYVAFEDQLIQDNPEAKTFWNDKLKTDVSPLPIQYDFPRPDRNDFEGGLARMVLLESEVESFQSFLKEEQITLFNGFTGIVNLFLYSMTYAEEITIGSPVSNRLVPELENQIGNFLNYLVIRHKVDEKMPVIDFLKAVQSDNTEMLKYQYYPFEYLIQDLEPTVTSGHNPFYDFLVITNSSMFATGADTKSEIEPQEIFFDNMRSLLDMTFFCYDNGQGKMELRIEFARALFKEETISEFIRKMERIIYELVSNKNTTVGEFLEIVQETKLVTEVSNGAASIMDEDF